MVNEPPTTGAPHPGETEQHQPQLLPDDLLFVNHATVERGLHRHAAALFAKERQRVLDQLPAAYREKFGAVGFCRESPVQIVSPYQVSLGPLRTEWMEAFCKHKAKGTLENLPYLVHWFQAPRTGDAADSVSLEPCSDFLSFETGAESNFDCMPKQIQHKYLFDLKLSEDEQVVVLGLRLLAEAAKRDRSKRVLPFALVPDLEQFIVLPCPSAAAKKEEYSDGILERRHNQMEAFPRRVSDDIGLKQKLEVASIDETGNKDAAPASDKSKRRDGDTTKEETAMSETVATASVPHNPTKDVDAESAGEAHGKGFATGTVKPSESTGNLNVSQGSAAAKDAESRNEPINSPVSRDVRDTSAAKTKHGAGQKPCFQPSNRSFPPSDPRSQSPLQRDSAHSPVHALNGRKTEHNKVKEKAVKHASQCSIAHEQRPPVATVDTMIKKWTDPAKPKKASSHRSNKITIPKEKCKKAMAAYGNKDLSMHEDTQRIPRKQKCDTKVAAAGNKRTASEQAQPFKKPKLSPTLSIGSTLSKSRRGSDSSIESSVSPRCHGPDGTEPTLEGNGACVSNNARENSVSVPASERSVKGQCKLAQLKQGEDGEEEKKISALVKALAKVEKNNSPLATSEIDSNTVERCKSILSDLLQFTSHKSVDKAKAEKIVNKFQQHPALGHLARKVRLAWHADRDTQQWREALESRDWDLVEAKVESFRKYFIWQLEDFQAEISERVNLPHLVRNTTACFDVQGQKSESLDELLEIVSDMGSQTEMEDSCDI